MPPLTPSERKLRAGIAGNESWAKTLDRSKRTEPGRAKFLASFEAKVDPENELDSATRTRLAESARKAYFQRLALKSSKARRARKTGRDG